MLACANQLVEATFKENIKMVNEKSLHELMAQYDAAEDAGDWDLCCARARTARPFPT